MAKYPYIATGEDNFNILNKMVPKNNKVGIMQLVPCFFCVAWEPKLIRVDPTLYFTVSAYSTS